MRGFQAFTTAPVFADVTTFAYRASQPVLILGSLGFQPSNRFLISLSGSLSCSFRFGMSRTIVSPSWTIAMGPPSAASGEMWPMQGPRVPPENLPSVRRTTDSPRPMPEIADVGESISRMPGPPLGPS